MNTHGDSRRFAICLLVVVSVSSLFGAAFGEPNRHCINSLQYDRPGDTSGSAEPPEVRAAATPMGPLPGGNHQVGERWEWYTWKLGGMPASEKKFCTIRGVSANAYVVVDDDVWNVQINQADVDSILDHFENRNLTATPLTGGVYPQALEAFGTPRLGLDNDPRVYLLYYDFDIDSDGFFWKWDTEDDATAAWNSNECEVLYLNCGPDPGVDHSPAGDYMLGVVAHEFQHLVHYSYNQNEESWVNEGLSEYAMFRYGADDPGWIADFLSNPDRALIPSGMFGSIHYGACWFYMVYTAGHYGDTVFSNALVKESAQGIAGIDNVLSNAGYSERFEDVYKDWVVANLLDDPSLGSGEFGYPVFDFAPLSYAAMHGAFPLSSTSGSVNRWAGDYIRFEGYEGVRIQFDGNASAELALSFVELDTDGILDPRVTGIVLDSQRDGSFETYLSSGYEAAVMIPGLMNLGVSPSNYTYSADLVTAPLVLYAVKPAPAPSIDLQFSWNGAPAACDLYRSLDPATLGPPDTPVASAIPQGYNFSEAADEVYFSIEGL